MKRKQFNKDYIRGIIESTRKDIFLQRLKALFEEPSKLLDEILEKILNKISEDIYLIDLKNQLISDRIRIKDKLKKELENVFDGLINPENLLI